MDRAAAVESRIDLITISDETTWKLIIDFISITNTVCILFETGLESIYSWTMTGKFLKEKIKINRDH